MDDFTKKGSFPTTELFTVFLFSADFAVTYGFGAKNRNIASFSFEESSYLI